MLNVTEFNKSVVLRFNKEFIEKGNLQVLDELVSDKFHNHTAVPGVPANKDGLILFLQHVLRKGFPDLVDRSAGGDQHHRYGAVERR